MAKRRRVRLRPTLRAVQVLDLPEIAFPAGSNIGCDFLQPDQLVFGYRAEEDKRYMIRQVQLRAGRAESGTEAWTALPQKITDAGSAYWACQNGRELVFVDGRKILRASPEGDVEVCEVEERITGHYFDLGGVQSTRGSMGCFSLDKSEFYLLGRDGRTESGPHKLPDEALEPNGFVADPAEGGTRWLYFYTDCAIYLWHLLDGKVDLLAGCEDASDAGVLEGVGGKARIAFTDCSPRMILFDNGLYIMSPAGVLRLDTLTLELQTLDIVDALGAPVRQFQEDGSSWSFAVVRDMESFAIIQGDETQITGVFIVSVSSDLSVASLEEDLAAVDWSKPLRPVQFDVGDAPTRFALDARLLKARSTHFARVLESGMRESEEGTVIRLEDTTPEAMQLFIHFLHTDEFEPARVVAPGRGAEGLPDATLALPQMCLAVHQFAERYGIPRLQKLSLLELQNSLSAATALPLLEQAAGDRAWDPQEEAPRACWEACAKHFDEIVRDHGDAIDGLVRRRPVLAARLIRSMASKALGPPAQCATTSTGA